MGRSPRIHVPGRIYHVTTRGNGGQAIVGSPAEFDELLEIIAAVKRTSDFSLFAYCLMSNHFHLLLQIGEVPLDRVMQRIKTSWAKRFNIKRRRMGHVFQGRFLSLDCDDEPYFMELLRYIHMNPVRAGLVSSPEQWKWSSCREYLDIGVQEPLADFAWPLSLFGLERRPAAEAFRTFMLQDPQEDVAATPMMDSHAPTPEVERPSASGGGRRPLVEIAEEVSAQTGVTSLAILGVSRRRSITLARRRFAALAVASGYGVREVSLALGVSTTAVSRMLRQGEPA